MVLIFLANNPNNQGVENEGINQGGNEYQIEEGGGGGEDASWRRESGPPRRHEPDPSFTQPNSYASGGGYVPTNNYETTNYRGRGNSTFSKKH